jgi:uncharacterized protein YecE (DUF72 family)
MEFGKTSDISTINWNLPKDDPKNSSHIKESQALFNLHFGAPVWGAKSWIGKIYPPKTPTDQFLNYYAQSFNCIELNTTHYRIPDEKTAKNWLSKVPAHFKFCPKIPKDISHARNGLVDKIILGYWADFLQSIQPNLGPCFIQLHEMFAYKDKMLLFQFLEHWPSEFRLSLELRHPSWFQNGVILPALSDYLNRKNIGLVITDVAGRRDVLHSSLSTNWTMIRLIGNNLDQSDAIRLKNWASRISEWKEIGLNEAFLFLHQPDDVMSIEFSTLAEEIFANANFPNVPHFTLQTPQDLLSFI